ncbi:hypothetical protein AB0F30_27450 [Streptomyces sp. NPDC029006]|uniref:hypothetical protein n=1 Tax=Streptomyces sp. NPDC029006 TaxID=3155467 RepID=UPI0033D0426A
MNLSLRVSTAAAVGALVMACPAAVSASAAPAPATSHAAAAGGTAPACIERNAYNIPDGGTQVYLRNLCGKTMRVKVIVKYGDDSGCKTMRKNTGWFYESWFGRYQRTVVC